MLLQASIRPWSQINMVNSNPLGIVRATLLLLSLGSAIVLAQSNKVFDPQASYNEQQIKEIYSDSGKWRQDSPDENAWRANKDETVQDRRFHFGSNSAYEEMRYQNNDRYRNMGSTYDDVRPSSLFQYNF